MQWVGVVPKCIRVGQGRGAVGAAVRMGVCTSGHVFLCMCGRVLQGVGVGVAMVALLGLCGVWGRKGAGQ